MKITRRTFRTSAILLAGASLVACAPFFEDGMAWRPIPGTRVVQADLRRSIGYYDYAVTAINDRHYALALEYLQAARAQNPNDVRVLTAFGVVYDKLGRFDLSARYYTQAAAIDPKSKIIAADLDYSQRLQGIAGAQPMRQVADAGATSSEGTSHRTVAVAPKVKAQNLSAAPDLADLAAYRPSPGITKDQSSPNAKVQSRAPEKVVFLTGHPLTILDASGRGDTDKSVRSYLSGLGWTISKGDDVKKPAQAQTFIVYEESKATAAKALARTLSLPLRLTVGKDIQGLQLVLGGDISGTNLAAKLSIPQRRQLALAATDAGRRE